MASVRLSHELRNEIRRNAMEAFETANPKWKADNGFQTKIKYAIQNSKWQNFAETLNGMIQNEQQTRDTNQFGLERIKVDSTRINHITLTRNKTQEDRDNELGHPRSDTVELEIELDAAFEAWSKEGMYGGCSTTVDIESLTDEDRLEINDLMTQAKVFQKELRDKEDKYQTSIVNLLDNCNTLKQLLESWPAAESLIPQSKIELMHKKVTRSAAAKQRREAVEFDSDEINQTVLTAKLVGG